MDSRKVGIVLLIEVGFLLAIGIITYLFAFNELAYINADFMQSKLIFTSVFFLLFRYTLFMNHSVFIFSKWVKRIVFGLNFIFMGMLFLTFRTMITEFDNIDLLDYTQEYLGDIPANKRVSLATSFRKTWIFFGVGTMIMMFVFQARLFAYRWKKKRIA